LTASEQKQNQTPRLIAKLTRELLHAKVYDSFVDLLEDIKGRCARLRIRYQPHDITEALRLIESNRSLTTERLR